LALESYKLAYLIYKLLGNAKSDFSTININFNETASFFNPNISMLDIVLK